jgi:energy-coupling factor transporter ATP-binding protein EcfA2
MPRPEERLSQFPHELSGGLRQRVIIAMALVCEPKLLIADEPTTALDVTIQAQILDLIDRLRRDLKMAVLLITHDMGVIAGRTDRVVVMYAGKKAESAATFDSVLPDAPSLHPGVAQRRSQDRGVGLPAALDPRSATGPLDRVGGLSLRRPLLVRDTEVPRESTRRSRSRRIREATSSRASTPSSARA